MLGWARNRAVDFQRKRQTRRGIEAKTHRLVTDSNIPGVVAEVSVLEEIAPQRLRSRALAASALRNLCQRFPVPVALTALVSLVAQFPLGADYARTARALTRYDGLVDTNVLPLIAAIGLALAGALFAESRNWRQGPKLGLSLAGAIAGFALLKFNVALGVYFGAALPAILGLVLVAPFLRRGSRDAFWHWLFRMAMIGLQAMALAAAVGLAGSALLLAAKYALGFTFGQSAFMRVWAFAGLFVGLMTVLALIPCNFDDEPVVDLDAFAFGPVRTVLDWVAAPFLLIYAVMLHIYALRILFSGDVPDGEIGMFTLIFSIVLVSAVVILRPLRHSVRWPTRFLLNWWPLMLVAPIALLLYAGLTRIGDQGVTPARYLFVLGALSLAVIAALQLWPRERNDIRMILIVPVAALIFASFGPWGALGRTIPSQAVRFQALVAHTPLDEDATRSARTILMLLDRYEALGLITPAKMPAADQRGQTFLRARIAAAYGLDQ